MYVKRLFLILGINMLSIYAFISIMYQVNMLAVAVVLTILVSMFIVYVNVIPIKNIYPNFRVYILASGCELLKLFLVSLFPTVVIQLGIIIAIIYNGHLTSGEMSRLIMSVLFAILTLTAIFWNGIIRVYSISIQLGFKHRVLGIIFGWFLGLNIYYLSKIIKICSREVEVESEKIELNIQRESEEICKTKYPILMVHGVFFRDLRYFNYWGRVPGELIKNGAKVFYGFQQSAASVESCGMEIATRIEEVIKETGCDKVNIIAHSKGGLDSRMAISKFGASPYVASLTTINTPHHGCIFSEYLLNKIPDKVRDGIAKSYNVTLLKLGDKNPDFIGAVMDLTVKNCELINESTPNVEGILYESFGSYCNSATSGRFPLNLSYNIVKYFDGKNDGLVSIDSAKWGSNYTILDNKGRRGISHGDMIDLNRENIEGFDVREFYVKLVQNLKSRGY